MTLGRILLLTKSVLLGNIGEIMGKHKRNKIKRKNQIIVRRGGVEVMKTKGKVFGVQNKVGCGCGVGATAKVESVKGTSVYPMAKKIGFTIPATAPAYVRPAPQPTFWETDIEVETVKSCGVFGDDITITVDPMARGKMNILMKKFQKMEWLAYLVGDKETFQVTDIVIPKQRVTSVNVYVDEPVDVPIIGVIHSHHDMGNNFSHTDDDYINQNHDISLCITNTKITGQVRVKTECGRFFLADANVVDGVVGFEADDFLKEIDDNISEKTYTHVGVVNHGLQRPQARGYGNAAGWDEFYGLDGSDEDYVWDTEAPSATAPGSRELIAEIDNYKISLDGIGEPDDYYTVEFKMLIGLIRSVNTPSFEAWEEKSFDENDTVYTEDYYRLIDEISLFNESLTQQEKVNLIGLANQLEKMIEVSSIN
jgi:hypothetical protein